MLSLVRRLPRVHAAATATEEWRRYFVKQQLDVEKPGDVVVEFSAFARLQRLIHSTIPLLLQKLEGLG